MNLALKIGIIVGALGAIGGTVALAGGFNNEKYENIEKRLKDIGYLVLTKESKDDANWNKLVEEYNKVVNKNDIFSNSTVGQETKIGLQSKCVLALSSNTSKQTYYSLSKRWCVKEETIKEMLERNNYTKLGPSSQTGNKPKWQAKVRLIKGMTENKRNITIRFNGNDNDVTLLENMCNGLNIDTSKTHANKEFEKHYLQAKEGCSLRGQVI